ncbi:MAG: ATP-binding protein [Planctomycetota bacterium]|jgi:signal transduction histidine kinase|nr:ATP-binding protein [Planctomycetota bacterium]
MTKEKSSQASAVDSQTLARLAGGLAHELKNPLSTIGLHLTLLQEDWEGEDSSKSRRTIRTIDTLRNEVERLNNILEDFLRFARTDSLEFNPASINALIEQVVEFSTPEAQRLGVQIHSYLDLNLPNIWIDKARVRQVLLNLIINSRQAIESSGEGSGNISLISRKDGAFLIVDIVDDGPGMDADTLASCFDVYFSTKSKGSGLGLATVRRIVEAHGGEMSIESAPGAGTKVHLRFPLTNTPDD